MHQHETTGVTLPFILAVLDTNEQALHQQEIEPQSLLAIYNDYVKRTADLTRVAEKVVQTLLKEPKAHAVRYRIKDPLHLLRKVIRKKKEYPQRVIDQHNYLYWINDLAGIRVLHLYREDWFDLSRFIQQTWKLKKAPQAYVRREDNQLYLQRLAASGCRVIAHPFGYAAVHFVVETESDKQAYFAEIQLKTLFEEGWSELDHSIRYSSRNANELLGQLLLILNNLAAGADTMASQILQLTYTLEKQALSQRTATLQKENKLVQLQAQIRKLSVSDTTKQQLWELVAEALQAEQL